MEANEATQTHCYNPVVPAYPVWLFGHIMCIHDNADAKRILLASPLADWRRQSRCPRIMWLSTVQQDLKHHRTLPEAADSAQNHPLWRMMSTYGTTQSHSCMPESTTTTLTGAKTTKIFNFWYKFAPKGYIPLSNFYQIWHVVSSSRPTPSHQILPLSLSDNVSS